MKKFAAGLALCSLSACTIQQGNGGKIELTPPPLFADQSWKIARQGTAPGGAHVCTVAAGEVEVTLSGQGDSFVVQVAPVNSLEPGDYYKIIVGGNNYETSNAFFNARDSQAIVQDFTQGGTAYTELRHLDIGGGGRLVRRSYTNKIPLDTFTAQYENCQRFLKY